MFHFIRLTDKGEDRSDLFNPAHIVKIEPFSRRVPGNDVRLDHSRILLSTGIQCRVSENTATVEELLRKAAFIPEEMFVEGKEVDLDTLPIASIESKSEPALKHIDEMDHDELVELSSEFLKNGSRFSRLEMLFRSFLLKGPSLSEIDRFFTKVRDMGYTFEKAV